VTVAVGTTCFTPVSLGKRWRCRPSKVRAFIASGLLKAFTLGDGRGTVRISPEEVERFEKARAVVPVKTKKVRRQKLADYVEYY
jgi:hypothetical protein